MPHTIAENLARLQAAKTAIANAITAKGGTVGSGDGLEDFPTDISTISTGVDPEPINAVLEESNGELETALGGGSSPVVAKGTVNFYDYDGTIVKSMSSAQFRSLESMPDNPTHEGLTAQGWNWSLSDAKTYVASYGSLNIGQQYITSDGKTRIYVSLPEERISPVLKLYLNSNTTVNINWGDGSNISTWTTSSADYKSERHNYPDKGDYVIEIEVVSGNIYLQSSSSSSSTLFTDGRNSNPSSDIGYLNSIQKIEIGSGVTTIQSSAFQTCYSLTSITIPNSIITIGGSAFHWCTSLSFITIPNSVISIQNSAFQNCYSLTSVIISNSVTEIGNSAFQNCTSLTSITIPNSITSIGGSAFQACYSLSSVIVPNSVTTIGTYAFYYCYSLSFITIPNKVTAIGSNVFYNCYTLTSVIIPDSVVIIQSKAFQNCNALSSVTIPNNVTTLGNSAFYGCYSLTSITIPNKVTTIGSSAFYTCYSLSSVTIPNSVTTIQSSAFQNCYSLSSVTIPNSVTSIENSTFSNCYSLTSITIPNGVTTIQSNTFYNCYSLSSVTIPNSVTSIQSNAFQWCTSLSSVTIPNSVTSIQSNAFYGCSCMNYFKFISTTPPSVQNSNTFTNVSTSTIFYVPALVANLYMDGTNYPSKSTYTYIGYATYESGITLPSTTTDETYTLTWYATQADAIAQTNPITTGNGNEVYARATAI